MLDVDHFKLVNDTYGHLTGDQVLRVVAEHCRENLREVDLLGRYGGDEFAALLPETDRANARSVAERLRQGIAQATVHAEQSLLTVHISLGVGFLDEVCTDLEDLLRRADRALYAAKRAGGNRVRVWQNQASAPCSSHR
jgi:diguanylate cyclase (GGDEF)-like protein